MFCCWCCIIPFQDEYLMDYLLTSNLTPDLKSYRPNPCCNVHSKPVSKVVSHLLDLSQPLYTCPHSHVLTRE
eukprot:UN23593